MRPHLLLCTFVLAAACAGAPPAPTAGDGTLLAPCPSSPNCVSSEATTEQHGIAPLSFEGDAKAAWARARAAVLSLPRTRLVVDEPGYLRAECTTAIMRYVDDLELHLQPDAGRIDVRSASRVGYGDMDANRERVEAVRAAYLAAGS